MPATAKPVAAYAARVMWSTWGNAAAFAIAASGRMFVIRPSTTSNPAGAFIHALAMTTNTPDSAPLTATSTPAERCARGLTRSQP